MTKWPPGAALLLPALLLAQSDAPGPRVATYRSAVDDSDQPYALYLPNSFKPDKPYPLVIALHEEESNHIFQLKRLFGIPTRFGESGLQALSLRTFSAPGNIDFIAACPFARGSMGYRGIAEQDVYDVLADVKRRFLIDEDRIYLTGSGMGGGGALWLALTRPGEWAAVAAICPDTIPGSEELAPNALNLPIRLFQGELDPLVPVESTRAWHRRLLNAGAPVEYVEYPGVRHNAWDFAYKNAAIFAWLAQFRRNAAPNHIHFVTRSPRYSTAYGLRIDGFQPGRLATIDATGNHIQTQSVDAFTIHVGQASWPVMEKPVVTIDTTPIRVPRNTALTFIKSATGWTLAHPTVAQRAVPAIADAVSARHIYVYPTLGVQTDDDLTARRRVAEQAASWSTARAHLNLTLAVKADNAITEDDIETADLVLFGTRETNLLISRFTLPIELSPAAADYGLLFIASTGKHYALISSGLPWWTGAGETHRGGYRFAPEPYRLLTTFGDYILFKGSLANVVSEGLYDSNWKIPPEAAAKMLGTGTVTIH
ncbi:MAG TPA: dienelactone hydrolase family protein [Candidatus Solibacter sp.]|nr:dienelactone hydrolase family protein [Candidatus Solibacter sp.]